MQKPEPILRPATFDDAAAVQALVFGILHEYGLEPDPTGTDADLSDPAAFYRMGWFRVLVLEGEIIGSVGLMPMGDGQWELRKMYLAGPWRGRGWGRMLLKAALAEARGRGARKLVLGTAAALQEAIGLYRSEGFGPSAEAHPAERCDQTWELILHAPSPNG